MEVPLYFQNNDSYIYLNVYYVFSNLMKKYEYHKRVGLISSQNIYFCSELW